MKTEKTEPIEIRIVDMRCGAWARRLAAIIGMAVVPICIGILADSAAMQWIGFMMSLLLIVNFARDTQNQSTFSTTAAAIAHLEAMDHSKKES
jgi:hypothetical protein